MLLGPFVIVVLAIVTLGILGVCWARAIKRRGVVAPPTYVFAAPNGATTVQMPDVEVARATALGSGQTPWRLAQTKRLTAGEQWNPGSGFAVWRRG